MTGRLMAQTVEEPGSTQPSETPQADALPPTHAQRAPESRRGRSAPRRTRVVVRKVGPLSVLKVSLIFYFCTMLVVFLGLVFLYSALSAVGVIDHIESTLADFNNENAFSIDSVWIFQRLFVAGCAMVVIWSLINVVLTFLYNLISDIVGGVEITLAEKR